MTIAANFLLEQQHMRPEDRQLLLLSSSLDSVHLPPRGKRLSPPNLPLGMLHGGKKLSLLYFPSLFEKFIRGEKEAIAATRRYSRERVFWVLSWVAVGARGDGCIKGRGTGVEVGQRTGIVRMGEQGVSGGRVRWQRLD